MNIDFLGGWIHGVTHLHLADDIGTLQQITMTVETDRGACIERKASLGSQALTMSCVTRTHGLFSVSFHVVAVTILTTRVTDSRRRRCDSHARRFLPLSLSEGFVITVAL